MSIEEHPTDGADETVKPVICECCQEEYIKCSHPDHHQGNLCNYCSVNVHDVAGRCVY